MFWEYKYVKRHTENLQLLRDLYQVSVTSTQAMWLTRLLVKEFNLPKLNLKFTGRKATRGVYYWGNSEIVVASNTNAEILVHEISHHYVDKGLVGHTKRIHGADFVNCLDKLAIAASNQLNL